MIKIETTKNQSYAIKSSSMSIGIGFSVPASWRWPSNAVALLRAAFTSTGNASTAATPATSTAATATCVSTANGKRGLRGSTSGPRLWIRSRWAWQIYYFENELLLFWWHLWYNLLEIGRSIHCADLKQWSNPNSLQHCRSRDDPCHCLRPRK